MKKEHLPTFFYSGHFSAVRKWGAKPQVVLKVGGKNGKLIASISDFGKKFAKVGGSCPPAPLVRNALGYYQINIRGHP